MHLKKKKTELDENCDCRRPGADPSLGHSCRLGHSIGLNELGCFLFCYIQAQGRNHRHFCFILCSNKTRVQYGSCPPGFCACTVPSSRMN